MPSPHLLRTACLIGALALLPLEVSQARQSSNGQTELVAGIETRQVQDDRVETSEFSALFEPFDGPPRPIALPSGAVDLDAFEPPIEQTQVLRSLGSGTASYYGRRFHGRRTANGERFDMRAMTAAHRTLPFGTLVRVTNTRNGREVTVRINDRGPFIRGRSIDLSRAAAKQIGMISRGHAQVQMDVVAP
ncbi:MAG: septal ring lytic transglycosylase RlpA family protein [Pseudomonadota bacterium]